MTDAEPRAIDLIIFDNDGVLVDTEHHANRVLATLLTTYGIPTSYEESLESYLGTSLRFVREACRKRGLPELPSEFEAQYHERLFTELGQKVERTPGALEVLSSLSIPFCVASSGTHRRIEFTLHGAGLWKLCENRIFSADDVPRGKPAPDLFLHAASALRTDPRRCLVVEDSPWGIEAANAARMTAVGFDFRTPKHRLVGASGGIISSLTDLPPLLAVHSGG